MSIPFSQPSHRSRSRFAPFCQGAKRFAAKGAIEAAGGAGQVMAVDGREVARRKSFHGAEAWMPRLRCLKAGAMLPAVPPYTPGPADCRVHQGPLFLSSPAFLHEPGHAVGLASPRIQLDQEQEKKSGGMILDCAGNRAAEPRLGLRGRCAETHQS